jgi:uncharacterized SAM-binding protein YcdF (DUF218 family)
MNLSEREIFINLVANDILSRADAVVLLEGDGFNRINKACSLIRKGWADTLIFSGGIDNPSYGSFPYKNCLPLILEQDVSESQIIPELGSLNTREQAKEVIAICQQKKWSSVLLVASHYHQYRAFLTFLKVLEERSLHNSIKIFNAPAKGLDWFEETPWGKRIDLLQLEFLKIEAYKMDMHISNYQTAVDYFKWRDGN